MDKKAMIKVINGMAEDIIKLSIKMDDRVKFAQIQADKIHKLEKRNKVLEEITDIHANQIHCICEGITSENNKINNKIKNIILMESETMEIESSFMDKFDSLENKIDDLKKYTLNMPTESIIDRLYALEQNDFNNVMGQAHETLKRVKNNKTEGK